MEKIRNYIAEYINLDSNSVLVSSIEFALYISVVLMFYWVIKKQVIARIRNKYSDDNSKSFVYLLTKNKLFSRIIALVHVSILSETVNLLPNESVKYFTGLVTSIVMIVFFVLLFHSFLNASVDLTQKRKNMSKLPLKPISQLLKVIITIVACILIYAKLINESASTIFAGLGALSAIAMLVFSDSIKSLVAAIQISLYNTVKAGDWITIPSLNVDGDVQDINLNIITIKNFDNTTTTIPTHSLMNNSFKNYRSMFGIGRRIKRTINLDVNSFRHLNNDDINNLKKINIISDYLTEREGLYINNESDFESINNRLLTNIGTFRKYMHYYLENNNLISKDNTLLVRQLKNDGRGLPIEIYCFTKNTGWLHNEEVACDIFDHFYTVLKLFGLNAFQEPTGNDFRKIV